MAEVKTIAAVRRETKASALSARVRAQVDDVIRKEDRNAKPFLEIKLRDASDAFTLKAWGSSPNFGACEELQKGDAIEIEGEFSVGGFGLEAQRWNLRYLKADEEAALYEGDEISRATNERDFQTLTELAKTLQDPRLHTVVRLFLEDFGPRFRRSAAARNNHHAFRGGLLRHTSQMMQTANALCTLEPRLNRDLLLAGALFHDCGKLWEMCPPENGFDLPRELRGELLGHISIGIEVANALWRKMPLEEWKDLSPASEDVRLHLLHLIAAHHGELQFGSPVEPKTPEAIALHYIDNLDARLEMIFAAFEKQPEIAPGIHERVWALNTTPVRGLTTFMPPAATSVKEEPPAAEADLF